MVRARTAGGPVVHADRDHPLVDTSTPDRDRLDRSRPVPGHLDGHALPTISTLNTARAKAAQARIRERQHRQPPACTTNGTQAAIAEGRAKPSGSGVAARLPGSSSPPSSNTMTPLHSKLQPCPG